MSKDRTKNTRKMKELGDSLDALAQQMEGLPTPLSLQNEDGTPNYANLLALLKDEQYSDFRDANPELVRAARGTMGAERFNNLMKTGVTATKLAFGIDQMRRAGKIDDTPPRFPTRPSRNERLRTAISDAELGAAQGLSDAERATLEEERTRGFNRSLRNIINTGGGQSGATQAGAQVASAAAAREALRGTALSEEVRRNNRQRLDRLVGMSMQEDANLSQFDRDRFRMREMPIWQAQSAAKRDLMQAGILNTFDAGEQLVSDVAGVRNMFRQNAPGTIYSNDYYKDNVEGANPLTNVFDNGARFMNTGQEVFLGDGYGIMQNTWGNPDERIYGK